MSIFVDEQIKRCGAPLSGPARNRTASIRPLLSRSKAGGGLFVAVPLLFAVRALASTAAAPAGLERGRIRRPLRSHFKPARLSPVGIHDRSVPGRDGRAGGLRHRVRLHLPSRSHERGTAPAEGDPPELPHRMVITAGAARPRRDPRGDECGARAGADPHPVRPHAGRSLSVPAGLGRADGRRPGFDPDERHPRPGLRRLPPAQLRPLRLARAEPLLRDQRLRRDPEAPRSNGT